jgi:hypothetical protein
MVIITRSTRRRNLRVPAGMRKVLWLSDAKRLADLGARPAGQSDIAQRVIVEHRKTASRVSPFIPVAHSHDDFGSNAGGACRPCRHQPLETSERCFEAAAAGGH